MKVYLKELTGFLRFILYTKEIIILHLEGKEERFNI